MANVDGSSAPSRSSPPQPDRHTREALLDAALDGFSCNGFRGTSIRDLADAVGIRESSVYTYFDSKQAIFDALVARADEGMAGLAARLGTCDPGGPACCSFCHSVVVTTDL